ncbi:uncharacterized protein BJX67DRAFT_367187 [Aspergillus lucknowensis]|uniref:Uncharacterized protein n=1 Tax=Aspergillus lucknowensis TaxID=176173 RepID=A0ABR4L990_9EURO
MHLFQSLIAWALTDQRIVLINTKSHQQWEQNLIPKYELSVSRPFGVYSQSQPNFIPYRSSNLYKSSLFFLWRASSRGKSQGVFWKGQEHLEPSTSNKAKFRLYLHVHVLRLSPTTQGNIDLRLAGNTTIRIGRPVQQLVHQLPFAYTWTDQYLYITISNSQLSVYRADLDMTSHPVVDENTSPEPCRSHPTSPYQTRKRRDSWMHSPAGFHHPGRLYSCLAPIETKSFNSFPVRMTEGVLRGW